MIQKSIKLLFLFCAVMPQMVVSNDHNINNFVLKKIQEKFSQQEQSVQKLTAQQALIRYQNKSLNPLCWIEQLYADNKEARNEQLALILSKVSCDEFDMLMQRQDEHLGTAPDEIFSIEELQKFTKRGGTKLKHWTLEETADTY